MRLRKSEVQRWLAGQRAAEIVIQQERTRSLISRTTEDAWQAYLDLSEISPLARPVAGQPSYLLKAMRQVLRRRAKHETPAP